MPISCRVRKACTLRPKLERSLGEEYLAIPMCPEQEVLTLLNIIEYSSYSSDG